MLRKQKKVIEMDYGDSKPKVYVNGKSAAKLRIGERSTTMGQRPVGFSESEKGDILTIKVEDGDIVCSNGELTSLYKGRKSWRVLKSVPVYPMRRQMDNRFDGDQLNGYFIVDKHLFNFLCRLHPSTGVMDLNNANEVSSNLDIPKPLTSTVDNWIHMEEEYLMILDGDIKPKPGEELCVQ